MRAYLLLDVSRRISPRAFSHLDRDNLVLSLRGDRDFTEAALQPPPKSGRTPLEFEALFVFALPLPFTLAKFVEFVTFHKITPAFIVIVPYALI